MAGVDGTSRFQWSQRSMTFLECGDLSPLLLPRRPVAASLPPRKFTQGCDRSQPKQKRWQVSALQKLRPTLR